MSSSNIKLDHDLLREILDADHSYYDSRLSTGAGDFIASQLGPEMRVLNIGCGSGTTLQQPGNRCRLGRRLDSEGKAHTVDAGGMEEWI